MLRVRRRLDPEFLKCLSEHDAIPKSTAVESWLREHESVKTGQIGKLLKGAAVSPVYAQKLVSYVLNNASTKNVRRTFEALQAFLSSKSSRNVSELGPAAIASMLLLEDEKDHLSNAMVGFLTLWDTEALVEGVVAGCPDYMLPDVVQWLFASCGRSAAEQSLELAKAERVGAAVIRRSQESYGRIIRNRLTFDPWSIALSCYRGHAVGAHIVLPLKESVYTSIRRGDVWPLDLGAEAIERPSNYILLEAVADRPPELDGPDENISRRILMSVMVQIAACTYRPGYVLPPIHCLSFGATPVSERRLISDGYKRVGTCLPGSNIPLYEMIVDLSRSLSLKAYVRSVLHVVGMATRDMIVPPRYSGS
ncbi:hypothetical protein Pan44_18870 [Caulifigura coniformis]|uniref:Uncharacterized protein n=1 Tax=Caulifigura coniformis TaxID=2527983 RepID=A0A517SCK8_9PLAN|nr:hypothetical protein [Caulifigura coniformis]QDT53861.1 hypothetical protein Pan44_18870 [Caulifigura coniformis]